MSFRARAGGVLRWFLSAAKGTLYPLDGNGEETALAVGTDGQVLTADATAPGGMAWADAAGGCTPELLVDDASGELLLDDTTGDLLYDDGSCVGGSGGSTSADLTTVLDTAAATVYVATTGDDTTGDGSSGAPYATFAAALASLPRSIAYVQTIDVADGTYAEPLVVEGVVCTGAGKILVTGDTTTPGNVAFTGTVSRASRGVTKSACAYVAGPAHLVLQGVTLDATADVGAWVVDGGALTLDRATVDGATTMGVAVWNQSRLELEGNVTISGFSGTNGRGIQLLGGCEAHYAATGTLTITGPGSAGWGIQVTTGSNFGCYSATDGIGIAPVNITITGVQMGFQIGLTSIFSCQAASSTITVDNVSTPSSSVGIQCTDCSSWSMNGTSMTLVLDHLSIGLQVNSLSYAEAVGTRTFTNLGTTSDATQNGVIYLP